MDLITKHWIILCVCLTIGLVIFMILWIVNLNTQNTNPNIVYSAKYGLYPGTNGVAINKCQPNGNSVCQFNVSSLEQCIDICSNSLSSICQGFVYSTSANLMTIIDVNLNKTVASVGSNLYIKQY